MLPDIFRAVFDRIVIVKDRVVSVTVPSDCTALMYFFISRFAEMEIKNTFGQRGLSERVLWFIITKQPRKSTAVASLQR